MRPAWRESVFGFARENISTLPSRNPAGSAEPCDAQRAFQLLFLAAAEEEARQRQSSNALAARVLGNGSSDFEAWSSYLRRLESSSARGPLNIAEIRRLAAEHPASGGLVLSEFQSILAEPDPELFSQACLALAQRNLRHDIAPAFSRELLRLAQAHESTRARAERELNLLEGRGGFLAQAEYQSPRMLRELCSPLMLASFGSAIFVSRAASFAVLARSSRMGLGTLLVSEGVGLATEVPTLVLSRRLGEQIFHGGAGVFAGEGLSTELLAGYTSFGLLRVFGNGLQLAAPGLRRIAGLNGASGALTSFGRFTLETLRLGGELSALRAGHSLNVALGLEPQASEGSQAWLQSLLTLGHMRLSGHLLQSLGWNPMAGAIEAQRQSLSLGRVRQLLADARLQPEHPMYSRIRNELEGALSDGRLGPFSLESWLRAQSHGRVEAVAASMQRRGLAQAARWFGLAGNSNFTGPDTGFAFLPELAFAGRVRPASLRDPRMEHVVLMSMNDDGNRQGPRSDPPPTRRVVMELLQEKLDEYTEAAETRDTVLGRAAKGLQDLLEKINERPDLAHDEAFVRRLQEIEVELQAAQEHGSTLRRSVETLKVLFRRSAAGGQGPLEPAVVEQKSAEIEADEAQRSAFATYLAKMQEALQKARDSGWTESLYDQLDRARTGVNELYGRTVYKIPGLNRLLRRGPSSEDVVLRRRGAVLGLALRPDFHFPESAVSQRLRGLPPESARHHDIELDLLHESVLLAARKSWNPHELQSELSSLGERYHSSEETRAAMIMTAQAVNLLVQQGPRAPDLVELLRTMPESLVFHDRFLAIAALRDPKADLATGIEQLGLHSTAPDYFASGLLIFLHSGGQGPRLTEALNTARSLRAPGYHPSIPVSLFGAAYGRKAIPEALLPSGADAEAFLIRAFPPENKPGS